MASNKQIAQGWLAGGVTLWILLALFVCFLVCYRSAIALGAAILQASSDFVASNSRIILLPLGNYIIIVAAGILWTIGIVYLASNGEPYYIQDSFVSGMKYTKAVRYLFFFQLFVLFWVLAFVRAMESFIIAATTCMWYFSGQGSDNAETSGKASIMLGTKWGYRYHFGTMAIGSFLVALINIIKVIFEYMVKKQQAAGPNNKIMKALICVTRCMIWCLDSCIKFINAHAYIQCALFSTTFCESAKAGFFLSVRNYAKFTALAISSFLIAIVGKGTIVALSCFICYLILNSMGVGNAPFFMAIVGVIAFFLACLFLEIFEYSCKAILHCFLLDQEGGGSPKTPESL